MNSTVDFYGIYKMFIQRCRRSPLNTRKLQMKEDFEYLIKNQLSEEENLQIAERLIELENSISVRKRYSKIIYTALESGNYTIDVPYPVLHRWSETEQTVGKLYLATSRNKAGQVKFGATTMPLWRREDTYRSNYGYAINIFWSREIEKPFSVEKTVHDAIKKYRVKGLTRGDSNEWYKIDCDEFVSFVREIIEAK